MISARSSAARCGAPPGSWPSTRWRSRSPRTCRCSPWTPSCSSRCCSTCWTTRRNTPRPGRRSGSEAGARGIRSACRWWTRAKEFHRPSSSTSSTSSTGCRKGDQVRAGTGLGLAISRGFVEALNGTIAAGNRTDRTGAVFTITPADSGAGEAAGHRRMSAAPLKVLVIDDEPPIRKLLRMGLGTQGYEILEAPNGKTALELMAGESGPDHSRSRPSRHPGSRAAADAARAQRARPDRRAVEPRRRGRQGAGARSRRRRLRHQAVRHGRAAGAHARGAAPSAAGARRTPGVPGRRSLRRPGAPHRQGAANRK